MVMSMNGAASAYNGLPNGGYVSDSPLSSSLDLIQVREQVREEDEGKWDATVFRDQLTLLNGKLLVPENVTSQEVEELTPTTWATAQMCGRLGIPTAYFRRCPLDLQDAQFNVWARHHDRFETSGFENSLRSDSGTRYASSTRNGLGNERWLIRAKHDSLRGVLSDRYTRLDNKPFLDCLEPLVPSRLQVKWFALTGESLHLRLIDPTLAREVLPDDRIMVGLHIANSEVGKRSVTVDAIVWRLVCQNGLVRLVKGKSLLQQRHIFVSQSNFKRDLERAMGEALTTAAGLLEKMAQSTTEHLEDIETVIEKIGERHQLSEAFQEKIKNALLLENRGQQETLYGLTNALTQAAQTLPPDDRYGMEVMAGEVMERGAIWLNGLPKAKARRKTELIGVNGGANGGSSFVSDAPSSQIPRNGSAGVVVPFARRVVQTNMTTNGLAQPVPERRLAPSAVVDSAFGSGLQQVETYDAQPKPEPNVARMTQDNEQTSARSETSEPVYAVPDKLASTAQKDVLYALCTRRGLGTYDLHYLMKQEYDKDDLGDLTQLEATQLTVLLQQKPLSELLAPVPEYDEDGDLLDGENE